MSKAATGTRRPLRLATRTVSALAVGAGIASVVATSAGVALASTATSLTTTTLSTDVLGGLSALSGTPVASTMPMQVGIELSDPNAGGLQSAYQAMYTEGSATYHQFMTPAQVAAQFGVDPTTAGQVATWTTRDGLHLVLQSTDNEYLLLQGTAAQVESTFNVSVDNFTDGTTTFYANTNGPTVPSAVSGVIGMNNLLKSHTFNSAPSATAPHGVAAPVPASAVNQSTCAGPECVGLTTPQDLWSTYDQPTDITNPNADFGQGQTMAVMGEGAVSGVISDLRIFEKEFALPQVPITVHSVGDQFTDTSGNGEWDIDTQASTGMAAKAAGETLYFANDLSDSSTLADFQAWAGDTSANAPLQANASFGECEEDPTSPVLEPTDNNTATATVLAGPAGVEYTQGSENALTEANLEGRTLFSSTGDTGSSCPVVTVDVNGVGNEAFPETNYPASSVHVVAVGGTVLYTTANSATSTGSQPASNAQRAQETAWTFTGGGNTFYIPRPAYQAGISLLSTDCVAQPDGTPYFPATPCRGIPDVAAQSGDVPTNGYAVTMAGATDSQGGGTSLSSPLWVGMWTRIQAAKGGAGNGFADPALYKVGLNAYQDPTAFFDVGQGVLSPPTGDGYYTSLPANPADPTGWDYVSGLGTPNVTSLGEDILGTSTLTPAVTTGPGPVQDCGQAGLAACPTSGGGSGGASTTNCSGSAPVWTNKDHTASDTFSNSDPQLSLIAGSFALSSDRTTLQATLEVENMSATVPTGATDAAWYATWSFAGTTYFGSAVLSPLGTFSYGDGTHSSQGYSTANSTDTGSVVLGSHGSVTIDVPLSHIGGTGALPLGSVLEGPAGVTYNGEGVPPNPAASGGAQLTVDNGGPGCSWVVAGPASAAKSAVTASPASVPADGKTASTVTVLVKDANGTPLPGDPVRLSAGSGSSTISPSGPVTTDDNGQAVFTVTDGTAQSVTYTAQDATTSVGSATVTFTAVAPTASASSATASPATVPANGTSSSTISVVVRTAAGSAVPGETITLTPSTGSKATVAPSLSSVTGASGAATFTVTDKTVQKVTFTVTDTTAHLSLGTVTIGFTKPTRTTAA